MIYHLQISPGNSTMLGVYGDLILGWYLNHIGVAQSKRLYDPFLQIHSHYKLSKFFTFPFYFPPLFAQFQQKLHKLTIRLLSSSAQIHWYILSTILVRNNKQWQSFKWYNNYNVHRINCSWKEAASQIWLLLNPTPFVVWKQYHKI